MKKFVTKALMVVGIVALGIFAGSSMSVVHAADKFGDVSAVSNVGVGGVTKGTVDPVALVKSFVNWILGLVSLVALLMALYGGFQMVTSAGDDTKYKAGFKVLKNAAIGLIIIGLSWIIVSSIFWVIGTVGGQATNGTPATATNGA